MLLIIYTYQVTFKHAQCRIIKKGEICPVEPCLPVLRPERQQASLLAGALAGAPAGKYGAKSAKLGKRFNKSSSVATFKKLLPKPSVFAAFMFFNVK